MDELKPIPETIEVPADQLRKLLEQNKELKQTLNVCFVRMIDVYKLFNDKIPKTKKDVFKVIFEIPAIMKRLEQNPTLIEDLQTAAILVKTTAEKYLSDENISKLNSFDRKPIENLLTENTNDGL